MTSSTETKILEHAAENGFNVLLVGTHGVGKTAMVREVFTKQGWNWKYFSASTIDPWVDLVGVPKEKDGVLELIRPSNLDFDNIEAIFLDEYNRAPKKVRNAVMELIQFRSINGKRFPKLKVIWAAINPDDDEELTYDVEKLDPAQIDRFEIHVPVPNEPCPYFFKNTYGNIGSLAVKWWQDQTEEIRKLVSPRRLEAGLRVHIANGDPQYVFDPQKVNTAEFQEYLDKPDPIELLDANCGKTDEEKRKFLQDENTYKHIQRDLLGKERYLKEYAHLIPEAKLMTELRDNRGNKAIGHVVANVERFEHLIPVVLSNHSVYSARVVDAFRAYKKARSQGKEFDGDIDRVVTIKGRDTHINRMVLCFTGKLSGYTRADAEELMRGYGAKITPVVTFETTHVVAGENAGAKLNRAKQQGVEILTEDQFYKIVTQLARPARV